MNHDHEQYRKMLRELRKEEDPSFDEELALEPEHLEVKHLIKAYTGLELEVQNTRHSVVFYLINDAGFCYFDFRPQDFQDPEAVVIALRETFEEESELMDILVQSGYKIPRS